MMPDNGMPGYGRSYPRRSPFFRKGEMNLLSIYGKTGNRGLAHFRGHQQRNVSGYFHPGGLGGWRGIRFNGNGGCPVPAHVVFSFLLRVQDGIYKNA